MTTEQFCYWFQGYMEIENPETIDPRQVQIIKDHLDLVFNKVTPKRKHFSPSPCAEIPLPEKHECTIVKTFPELVEEFSEPEKPEYDDIYWNNELAKWKETLYPPINDGLICARQEESFEDKVQPLNEEQIEKVSDLESKLNDAFKFFRDDLDRTKTRRGYFHKVNHDRDPFGKDVRYC